jgi:hypothetical protein
MSLQMASSARRREKKTVNAEKKGRQIQTFILLHLGGINQILTVIYIIIYKIDLMTDKDLLEFVSF